MPFVGEIRIFACNFAPNGFNLCDGTELPVNRNPALYSVIGQTYGGNGSNRFALPDLTDAAAICYGSPAGLTAIPLGGEGGASEVLLTSATMAAHSHKPAAATNGKTETAAGAIWAPRGAARPEPNLFANFMTGKPAAMASGLLSPVGGSGLHNNLMPYQGLNFCIALVGDSPTGEEGK